VDGRLLDQVLAFADHFGIRLYPWQRDAFGQACRREGGRFVRRLAGASVPRGNGKSYGGAVVGLWRLLCGRPPQDIISAALDYDGAKVVLDHARSIVRGHDGLADAIEVQANGLYVPATRSRWTITSREHTASRGRQPTLVIYDEVGWASDVELFSSLLAGQASVDDPLMLVISTVGRRQSGPLWSVKILAEGGDPAVFWTMLGRERRKASAASTRHHVRSASSIRACWAVEGSPPRSATSEARRSAITWPTGVEASGSAGGWPVYIPERR